LEHSRDLLDRQGVRIAAISYDSAETLSAFAAKYGVRFPLLSDRDSAVIRSFGIFNFNIAPGLRGHGVPHPVEYLVAPDGTVVRKYFVPNYQHRVTGSAVALHEFGVVASDAPVVTVTSGAITVQIVLASATAFAGQKLGFSARFAIEPGWHIYETTSLTFSGDEILSQSFTMPELPSYEGRFDANGTVLLKFPLKEGPLTLGGNIAFQQCSESICEPPERLDFELVVRLEKFLVAGQ
jgi:hypothetical protein